MVATHFTNGFKKDILGITKKEKSCLLRLARKAIKHYFETKEILKINTKTLPKNLLEKHGVFVTIYKNGLLRGCIGNLYPKNSVYIDVIQNSIAAAFGDPRFFPLNKAELKEIKIEISILTNPKKLAFSSPEDLLSKVAPDRDGVVFLLGGRSSTFLPKVWEAIPEKEEFFSQLCLKAGLGTSDWKEKGAEVYIYHTLIFGD